MPDLLAGQIIRAQDFPPSVFGEDATDLDNVTNTDWAAGSPALSITFQAATTGRGRIDVWALLDEDSNGGGIRCSVQVRKGSSSGAIVYEPGSTAGVASYWVNAPSMNESASGFVYLSGLESGAAYWAQFQHQVNGTPTGALDIAHRALLYTPLT